MPLTALELLEEQTQAAVAVPVLVEIAPLLLLAQQAAPAWSSLE
jgi:hypothetical protein